MQRTDGVRDLKVVVVLLQVEAQVGHDVAHQADQPPVRWTTGKVALPNGAQVLAELTRHVGAQLLGACLLLELTCFNVDGKVD